MHWSLCWTLCTILLQLLLEAAFPVTAVHRSLDEAKAARQKLVRKHLKRLKKADGAIKLVGGAGDYEGSCSSHTHTRTSQG